MRKQDAVETTSPTPRRHFFRKVLAGSGMVVASSADAEWESSSATKRLQWINASRARLGRDLESDVFDAGTRVIRGLSYSTLAIHFDLPLELGGQIEAIWLRIKMQVGARLTGLAVFDCEQVILQLDGLEHQVLTWDDLRLALPQPCKVQRSLSLCLYCSFDGVERELQLAAIACEARGQHARQLA